MIVIGCYLPRVAPLLTMQSRSTNRTGSTQPTHASLPFQYHRMHSRNLQCLHATGQTRCHTRHGIETANPLLQAMYPESTHVDLAAATTSRTPASTDKITPQYTDPHTGRTRTTHIRYGSSKYLFLYVQRLGQSWNSLVIMSRLWEGHSGGGSRVGAGTKSDQHEASPITSRVLPWPALPKACCSLPLGFYITRP